MRRICFSLFITLVVASANASEILDLPRLGPVAIIDPTGPPVGIVILFSDPAATVPISHESMRALAEAGQAVAVVDSQRFLAALDRAGGGCSRASGDLVALKSLLLARPHFPKNASTLIAGPGAGGTLAYAVLAQSEPGQFSGAVAFGFNPELPGRQPLCPGAPYAKTPSGFRYLPVDRLNGFWRMATASPGDKQLQSYAQVQQGVIFTLRPYDDLASAIIGVISDVAHASLLTGPGVDDLPLVLLPADHHGKTMAIIYSGDGGWRDLDKQIGEALQKDGIPVVGVDTLRGFWHRQTPESAAAGLERIIDHFADAWGTPDVLLIGYSFGAEIIKTAGGHHFDGDYGQIAHTIIDGAVRRGAGLPSGARP
jgi:type IV secretory pathway VirJ component